MDIPIFTDTIENMKLMKETNLNYWQVSTSGEALGTFEPDGDGIRDQLSNLLKHTAPPTVGKDQTAAASPPSPSFTFLYSEGDAATKRIKAIPLHITRSDLEDLIDLCQFPRHILVAFGSRDPSISRHVHYDESTGKPMAFSILLRIPRNSEMMVCALRVRLEDNSAVCFASSLSPEFVAELRQRLSSQTQLLLRRPERAVLGTMLGLRAAHYNKWLNRLWQEVNELESATQMTRSSWRSKLSLERAAYLADHGNLLTALHAAHTELTYCNTVYCFAVKFAVFSCGVVDFVEELRRDAGLPGSKNHVLAEAREEFGLVVSKFEFQKEHVRELIERLKGQINVTFSLVTQKDSKINLAVAEDSNRVALLAARDSQTMKTITVLTLVFLPPSLVTAIWSAGVIQLDEYWRWRVYLLVSVGLTLTVLSVWVVYMRAMDRKGTRAPVRIAGVGYVRDGRMLSFAG